MNNLKRSFPTLLALVLLAVLAGGCTKSARRNRILTNADRYFAAEQYDQAEANYVRAMKLLSPPSTVAIRQLGLIYAEEGKPMLARVFLERAVTNEPENVTVQLAMARAWASLGQTARAKEFASTVLKLQPGNEPALLLICESVSATNAADLAQTKQYVEKLQKQDQDRSGYHLALGILDSKSKDLAGAEAEFKKGLALDPKSSFGYLYMASLCVSRNDQKGTEENFKKAVQLAPTRSPVQMQYVNYLQQTGATNQAREVLLEMIRKAPDYMPALIGIMELSRAENKLDECETNIAMVLARDPYNPEALMDKGGISMARGNGKQAVADFERMSLITAKSPRAQVQYELALAYLLDGSRPKALTSLNRALQTDSNYIPAKLLLADLDIRDGNSAAAVTLLKQMESKPQPEQVLEQVKLVLATAYLAENNTPSAVAEFETLEKLRPLDAEIPYLRGKAFVQAGDMNKARAAFEKSFAINSRFIPALEELVDLDLVQGRFSDAEERVKKQMDKDTNAALPMLLQAKIDLVETNNAQAEKSLLRAIELDPKMPAPYLLLGRLYIMSHQEKQALDKLNALVAVTTNAPALLQIGMIHSQMKEYELARDSYEKVLAINSNNTAALNNLAYIYSDHLNQPEKAYQLAQRNWDISAGNPTMAPYAADTLGWLLYKRGEYPRALVLLQQSADKETSDVEVHYHLGMAHYMMGEEDPAKLALRFAVSKDDFEGKEEARHFLAILDIDPKTATPAQRADLEKQLTTPLGDPIALMKLAAIEEREGNFEKAAGHYETAVKQNSQDVLAMIQLARLYSEPLKQPQKGLEMAKEAHKVSPDDANVSALLGRLDFQAGSFSAALDLLQDAARRLPGQPGLLHDLAWSYYSMGNTAQAQAMMQSAADAGVPFAKLDDAKQFLAMMAAGAGTAQPDAAAQVQKVLQADANYAPALMASALMQERQGRTNEAERLYDKVLAEYPLFAPANRQLGILYSGEGNNDAKAYENLEKARNASPDDPEVARASGIVAFRRNEYQKSSQWLVQSVQKHPDDPEVNYYLGMDYLSLKQAVNSKKYLQLAANSKLPNPFVAEAKRVLAAK